MSENRSYTAGERLLVAIGLAVALLGVINLAMWQLSLLGLSGKQIAILSFIPLFLILYYVLQRPDPRRAK